MFNLIGDGKPLACCNPDGSAPAVLPKECLKITTPKDDPDSKNRCYSTQRGSDTADIGCSIKPVRKVCIGVVHSIFRIKNSTFQNTERIFDLNAFFVPSIVNFTHQRYI